MTVFRPVALLLALGLLQVFLPQVWAGFGAVDWLLIYVVRQSSRGPFQRAVLLGAGGGLVQDGLSGGIVGLHAFAKTCVAALIASFANLLVLRGPLPEAIVVGAASAVESLLVIAWQVSLDRPASLGAIDVGVRATATAAATLAILLAAGWWQRRAQRRRVRMRRRRR